MLAERARTRTPGERNGHRLTRTTGSSVKQQRHPRQLRKCERWLLHFARNFLLPIYHAIPRLPRPINPRRSLVIDGDKRPQIALANHYADTRQHRPHIAAAIAPQVNDPPLRFLGLQVHHDAMQLVNELLKIRPIFLPFRIRPYAHGNCHMSEDPGAVSVDMPLHLFLWKEWRSL